MRERGLILALLAGIGAGTYRSSGTNSSSSSTLTPSSEGVYQEVRSADRELANTFMRFDKGRTFTIRTQRDGTCEVTADAVPGDNNGGVNFDWAIAVVPDPERSNLKLDFDREIEAIENATANAGYQFERYWFPWRAGAPSPRQTSYVIRSDSNPNAAGTVVSPTDDKRDNLPGVLLFRNKPGKNPLALFLVSESPTGGIAPEEFRSAVCLGQHIAALNGVLNGSNELRIIGPGLSGSLEPLSTLIRMQTEAFDKIIVRTWTKDHSSHKRFRKSLPSDTVDFEPLDVDSLPAVARFMTYVRTTWHDNTPFALLVEESTAYGAAPLDDKDEPKQEQRTDIEIQDFLNKLGTQNLKQKYTLFKVPFPRNLSKLRNATEKHDHLPGFGDDSTRIDVPHNGLFLTLKQEADAALEVPTFSREQTPISQESVLFTIGGLLKTGVVHYVGILATDPLDTLFLTRYLHKAAPNVRVFTLDPDMLFEHGSDSSDFSGMIGLSKYPLIPLTQIWNGPRDLSYVFPSPGAEAAYNATLRVLHQIPDSPIFPQRPKDVDLRDRFDPFTGATDAVWVTVAGRSGFEPITVLDCPEDVTNAWKKERNKAQEKPDPLDAVRIPANRRFPPEYWPGWGYAFFIILFSCLSFCVLILVARHQGRRAFALFAVRPDEYERQCDHDPFPRAFYLFAMGSCLNILTAYWLAAPGFILHWNLSHYPLGIVARLLFFAGAAAVVAYSAFRNATELRAKKDLWTVAAARGGALAAGAFLFIGVPRALKLPALGPTNVTFHLFLYFAAGSFCLGATVAASILPLCYAAKVEHDKRGSAFLRSLHTTPYFWVTSFVGLVTLTAIGVASYTLLNPSADDFLAAYRSLDLTNGVSPLIPVTILFTALTVFSFLQLRRIAYYEERLPDTPAMEHDRFCPGLDDSIAEINLRTRGFQRHPLYWLACLSCIALGSRIFTGCSQTLERRHLELLIMGAILITGFLVLLIWVRLMLVWSAFSKFLQQLERHPIRRVFSLLPRGFIWSPVWQGGGKKRTHVAITRSLECMHALVNHAETPAALKQVIQPELAINAPGSLASNVKALLAASAGSRKFSRLNFRALESGLARVAQAALEYLQQDKWQRGDYELRSELAVREETKEALHTLRNEFHVEEPSTICGELIAFRFLAFINFVLWHMENLVTNISLGFLLLVLSLNSYAFRSRTVIDFLLVMFFAVLTIGIVITLAQADRDAILSRITGTEEGKLDRNFFTHLISYGGVPTLVLLSTHFPTIGRFFFSWVKPALESIH